MLMFFNADQSVESIPGNEKIKIKFEVDTNPPASASFERRYRLLPVPYEVMLYDMPSLFAGKVHAVICRAWKSRIKGRMISGSNEGPRSIQEFVFALNPENISGTHVMI